MSIAGAVTVRKALKPKQRRVLGLAVTPPKLHVPMPNNGAVLSSLARNLPTDIDSLASGVSKTGRQVGRAGKQLGKVATDIQRAGETTERLGKLLAK